MLLFGRHECRDSCFTLFHLRCDICFAFVSVPTTKPHFTLSTTRSMSHSPTPLFHIFFFTLPSFSHPFSHWTYRQSIQTPRRQFAKRCKRSIRPRKHETNELRNIRVKLNWEDHIWSLFITTVNKYWCAYSMLQCSYMSCSCSPACEEWRRKRWYILYIYAEVIYTDIYTYIYIYIYIHTNTHTHILLNTVSIY